MNLYQKLTGSCRIVERIPQTIRSIANNFFDQTGFIATIIVAGKNPADGGLLSYEYVIIMMCNRLPLTCLTSYHSGEIQESGATWPEADSQWSNVRGRYLKHARRVLGFGECMTQSAVIHI